MAGERSRRYGFFQIANPFTTRHWEGMLSDPVFLSSARADMITGTTLPVDGGWTAW